MCERGSGLGTEKIVGRDKVQIPVVKSIPGVRIEQMIVPKRLWESG